MSNTDYQHIVTMRSALDCVAPRSERLLNKLAPVVAAEDDVGPAVIRRLCRTSLLERLGLTTAEQQLVLKAILAALQEKDDHIPTGPRSGSELLDLLLIASGITTVQSVCHVGEFGRREALVDELYEQRFLCERVLCSVQKRLVKEECKQQKQLQQQEQQPLLKTNGSHVKLE